MMPLAAGGWFDPSPQQWLILGLLFVAMGAVIWVSRRAGREASPKQYRREIDSATRQQQQVQRDLETLLTELESAARRLDARMSEQADRLERLLAAADERAVRITALLDRPLPPPPPAPPAPIAEPAGPTAPGAGVTSPASAGAPSDAVPAADSRPVAALDPVQREIYALADGGIALLEIARRVQRSAGEVELILNLRQRG